MLLTDSSREGVEYQVTSFDGGNPVGHRDYNDFDDALGEFLSADVVVTGIDDARPVLDLAAPTPQDLKAKEARATDEKAAAKAVADREREAFALTDKTPTPPKTSGVQESLSLKPATPEPAKKPIADQLKALKEKEKPAPTLSQEDHGCDRGCRGGTFLQQAEPPFRPEVGGHQEPTRLA